MMSVMPIKYRACPSSIILYICSMLSLNLTKYKVLYCFKISINTTKQYYFIKETDVFHFRNITVSFFILQITENASTLENIAIPEKIQIK